MSKRKYIVLAIVGAFALPVAPSQLGTPSTWAAMEAVIDAPGPLQLETVSGARWSVDRSGLIDLKDPAARAAGLEDGLEPIEIFFHAIRHPQRGLYLVDTGVERDLKGAPERAAIRGIVAKVAGVERMQVDRDTASWLAAQPKPPAGVLLTHAHLDHVSGLRDVPTTATVYTGPGELAARSAQFVFTQPSVDRALEGRGPVQEWAFDAGGVVDVFGDGSLWAIHAPGHTPGTTAFLARTVDGPVLLTGDVCHTAWGWEHGVPPGSFTADREGNRASLARLREVVQRHPKIVVKLGHQRLASAG